MVLLYSAALALNAALLFVLEPMVGKLVLPLLGATPQVWTCTVLFFQAALLAGYAYGHLTTRLSPRRQAMLQVALIAAAAVALPIGIGAARPPHGSNPTPWLLGLLVTTAGAPFVVLAANAPLLQRWLSRVSHPAARDPYFLFAASNGGSLLGLLAYPFVIEPLLTLHSQERLWSVGYGAVGALALASAALLWLRPAAPAAGDSVAAADGAAPSARRRLRWIALALVPSSLMLGTTTYLTRDLAPIPLLWVVPLAIYLMTFVAAFAPGVRPERIARAARWLLPGVAVGVVYTLAIGSQRPLWLLLAIHLAGLATAGLMCHSLLAADRPQPARLTEYYLCVAAGGVAGGLFNAILAPLVFPGLVEYPLAIVAALALRPAKPATRPTLLEFLLRDKRPTRLMDAVGPALLLAALAIGLEALRSGGGGLDARSAIVGLACGLAVNFARRPLRFALGMGAIVLAAALVPSLAGRVIERDRSFFGIYRVVQSGSYHELYDGTTLHGAERLGGGRPDPLTYYSHAGPAGQAFAALPAATTRRAALIGLGAGALACDAPAGADWTFFEIDPVVARIARDPHLFTYLRDCPGRFGIALGDGRQSLARQPRGRFGVVVLDAFASDAIPVHLITRQAIELYLSRLQPGGVLLFHISNRYLDLEPVLGNLARDRGLACLSERHVPTPAQAARGYSLSQWAILARSPGALRSLAADRRWRGCRTDGSRVWTDDYSSVLSAVKWG